MRKYRTYLNEQIVNFETSLEFVNKTNICFSATRIYVCLNALAASGTTEIISRELAKLQFFFLKLYEKVKIP